MDSGTSRLLGRDGYSFIQIRSLSIGLKERNTMQIYCKPCTVEPTVEQLLCCKLKQSCICCISATAPRKKQGLNLLNLLISAAWSPWLCLWDLHHWKFLSLVRQVEEGFTTHACPIHRAHTNIPSASFCQCFVVGTVRGNNILGLFAGITMSACSMRARS